MYPGALNIHYMYCIVAIVDWRHVHQIIHHKYKQIPYIVPIVDYPCLPCCPLRKYQNTPAIVDCTHVYHGVHYANISTHRYC